MCPPRSQPANHGVAGLTPLHETVLRAGWGAAVSATAGVARCSIVSKQIVCAERIQAGRWAAAARSAREFFGDRLIVEDVPVTRNSIDQLHL